MGYQKIFAADGDSQDVEVFEALSLICIDCRAETIVRAKDGLFVQMDAAYHLAGCSGKSKNEVLFRRIRVGWGFAFGTESFAWDDVCEHYHFKTEGDALQTAKAYFNGTLNRECDAEG